MSIQLLRVDERLIHGQVVVGWGNVLHPDRIIVVDDELAASGWEQELYTLGLPPDLATCFVTVDVARTQLASWAVDEVRSIVLTRDIATMARIAQGGILAGVDVNIGGLHFAPGRKAVLPYVYLDAAERGALERLLGEGVSATAQDLPGGRRVAVEKLLRDTGRGT